MLELPFEPGDVRRPNRLPSEGEVHLWWIDLDLPESEVLSARQYLDPDELRRADRFRFDRHRRRFIVRRAQLRRLLGDYLGITAREVRFELGERGKPSLAPELMAELPAALEFNLSDSADVAVVGFQLGQELGVDVEVVREMRDALSISRHFFAEPEQEVLAAQPKTEIDRTFFRCWTRKEAYIKAVGQGLALPLDSFIVSMAPDSPSEFLGFVGYPGEEKEWSLFHLEPQSGVFVAVAARRLDLCISGFRAPSPADW